MELFCELDDDPDDSSTRHGCDLILDSIRNILIRSGERTAGFLVGWCKQLQSLKKAEQIKG